MTRFSGADVGVATEITASGLICVNRQNVKLCGSHAPRDLHEGEVMPLVAMTREMGSLGKDVAALLSDRLPTRCAAALPSYKVDSA